MTLIGAGWLKQDKNEEFYISCSIDEAIQPLTLSADKRLSLKPNKSKSDEKQPDYYIELWKPKQKENNIEDSPF